MATLEEKIRALEEEIAAITAHFNEAIANKDQGNINLFGSLITTSRNTLNALYQQLHLQQGQSGGGNQGQVCFEVQACVTEARKSKGYRYLIYKCAEECHAAYCPDGSSSSIYYDGNGLDLQIRLLFKSERDAEDFQTKLNSFASEHPHFREKLNVARRIGRVNITAELERVLRTDYNSGDNIDSPEMSLNDVLSDSASVDSAGGGGQSQDCYVVSARIVRSKPYSGYRRLIFEISQEWRACYDFRNADESIWYRDDGSDDLCISLMFKQEADALSFIGRLANYQAYNKFRNGIEFQREPVVYSLTAEQMTQLKHVYVVDYNPKDSSSPQNSRDCTICSSEVTSNSGDTDKGLRSLEDLSKLAPRESINRCHIAAQTPYPQYKNDPDNIIYGSHLFHDYFDGDGKKPPPGASVDWGIAPELLLEFIEAGNKQYFGGVEYVMVHVNVVFRRADIAKAMDGKWRDGSTIVSELVTRTYFYTKNTGVVERYLRIKAFETQRRWKHCDGEEVDFTQEYAE